MHRDKFHFDIKLVDALLEEYQKCGICVEATPSNEKFEDKDDIIFYEVALEMQNIFLEGYLSQRLRKCCIFWKYFNGRYFLTFFYKFPLFSRLCTIPTSKYVSFSLIFALMGKQESVPQPPEKETQTKPKIPPKPVMPAEAAAYPKLFKIYKELNRQNEIIFEAEKERNVWELERDDLKGLARFAKKGGLQSKIDHKNEEIEILKIGLSGIAKRYGYQNVQEFYRIYHKSHNAYADYKEQVAEWEKIYSEDSQRRAS